MNDSGGCLIEVLKPVCIVVLAAMFSTIFDIYDPLIKILKVIGIIGIITVSLILFFVIPEKRRILRVVLPLLILVVPIFSHINGVIYNNKMKNYLEIEYGGFNTVGNLESVYNDLGTDNVSDGARENTCEIVCNLFDDWGEFLYVAEVIKDNTSYKGADAFLPILIEEFKYLKSHAVSEKYTASKTHIYYFYEMIDEDTIKINLDKKVFEEKDK